MTDSLMVRLEGVRHKLERLGDIESHSAYRPPVPEETLVEFERAQQVTLPEEYRAFVRHVMAGGHGPYYGLTPFEFAAPDPHEPAEAALLRAPFPVSVEEATHPGAPRLRLLEGEVFFPGTLILMHQGRGYYASLVVSGAARGRVVYLNHDRAEDIPYFVQDANFLDWYERWLDLTLGGRLPRLNAVLSGARQVWFGFDNPAYEIREYEQDELREIEWRARKIDA